MKNKFLKKLLNVPLQTDEINMDEYNPYIIITIHELK